MPEPRCVNPLEAVVLADYWLGTLPPAEEASIEEHLLGCDQCSLRLQEVADLAAGVRALAREGALRVVVSPAFLERAASEGLRIRQYAPPNGGGVNCTITPADDLLIARLAADLSGASRVDLSFRSDLGSLRLEDIPVNPQIGEVILNEPAAAARSLPAHVGIMQLIAVDETGERVLGEYTFNHSPS